MLIALDFDGTYTADPELWGHFIGGAQEKGHEVVIATMRTPEQTEQSLRWLAQICKRGVVFTSLKAKRKFLEELNLYPDIWIDDNPEFVAVDAR